MAIPAITIHSIIVSLSSPLDVKKTLLIKYTDKYGITLHIIPIADKQMLSMRNVFPSFE